MKQPDEIEIIVFVVKVIYDTQRKKYFATVTKNAFKQNETGYCDSQEGAIKAVILT